MQSRQSVTKQALARISLVSAGLMLFSAPVVVLSATAALASGTTPSTTFLDTSFYGNASANHPKTPIDSNGKFDFSVAPSTSADGTVTAYVGNNGPNGSNG